jgi:hypothetical protein
LLSLLGVIATALVRADELTSLWCLYAALVSVLILQHFRRQRAPGTRIPTKSDNLRSHREAVWSRLALWSITHEDDDAVDSSLGGAGGSGRRCVVRCPGGSRRLGSDD